MRLKSLTLAAIVGALMVCGIITALVWPGHSVKRTLPDGTVLVLSGVRIGQTNVYYHGSLWSKMLGRFASSNGVAIGGLKLQPPETITVVGQDGSEVLSAELMVIGDSPGAKSLQVPAFYRKFRWLIYGDDDFTFVKEFNDPRMYRRPFFPSIWAESFPRDSRRLHFRLEERDAPESSDWREVATFIAHNPKRAVIQPWQAQRSPRIQLGEGLAVEVGQLTVRKEPIHPRDIWDWLGLLPVRLTQNGAAVTNWGIHSGPVWDASGNMDYFTFSKTVTNDWMFYRIFRPLDPTKPWRFRVHFALDSDFPRTNLGSLTVPWPLAGIIRTNLDGLAVRISCVNQSMLSVELPAKPAGQRLTFIRAVDEAAENVDDMSGSWSQHSFWRSLKRSSRGLVHVTVAIHPDYPAEFTLQPRYERPSSPSQAGPARPK